MDAVIWWLGSNAVLVAVQVVPGALLITIHGECVDVPEDEREEWLRRNEPEPNPLT